MWFISSINHKNKTDPRSVHIFLQFYWFCNGPIQSTVTKRQATVRVWPVTLIRGSVRLALTELTEVTGVTSWFWISFKRAACHLLQAVVLYKCRGGSRSHCSLCQVELPRHGSPVRLTLSFPRALKAASISQRWGTKARVRAYDFQHPGPPPAPTLGPFGLKKAPTGFRKGQERTKERESMRNLSSPR